MGILKASQKRTKRAPFTDELMSRQPERRQRHERRAGVAPQAGKLSTVPLSLKNEVNSSQCFLVSLPETKTGLHWTKTSSLTRSHFGLVTHDSDSAAVHAGESHHDVFGVAGHDLEEVPLVHRLTGRKRINDGKLPAEFLTVAIGPRTHGVNDVQHVVGFGGLERDDGVQRRDQAIAVEGDKE